MGLLSIAKSVGAKIFGGTQAPDAPPEQLKQKAEKSGHDVSTVGTGIEVKEASLAGEAASTEDTGNVALDGEDSASAATVEDENSAAGQALETKLYTVQPGDTLWKIAEAEYGGGHASTYNLIFEANKPMLTDPDKIYPGQVLRIPPLPTVSDAS